MGIKNIVNAGQKEELNGLMKSKRSYFDYGFDCAGHENNSANFRPR